MEIPLTKPIMAHDEEITVLELREPSPKDARMLGLPYGADTTTGYYIPKPEIAAKYIARLAGIPASSVDSLSIVDFNNAVWVVMSFFLYSADTMETKLEAQMQKLQELQELQSQ